MQVDMNAVKNIFDQGITMQAVLDLDPNDLEHMYAYACQLFESEQYDVAKKYYLMLVRLSHWRFDYWFALGLTYQRLGDHPGAIHSFSQSAQLRMDDPRSAFLSGQSLVLLGRMDNAKEAFEAALKWCGDKTEHAELKKTIQQSLSLI